MRKMTWEVVISEVDNGYIVRVGCKALVFTARSALLDELDAYMQGKPTPLSEHLKKIELSPNPIGGTCAQEIAAPPPQGECRTEPAN